MGLTMKNVVVDKKPVKDFGLLMAVVFLVLSVVLFIRNKTVNPAFLVVALFFLILSLTAVGILRPLYTAWMKLAFLLSWVNTRLILILLYFCLFLPIGFFMKIFGADPIDKRIERSKKTYWVKKEAFNFSKTDYERQF